MQGTSKPTHYYVLHDDARLPPDVMQQMTNYLCYTCVEHSFYCVHINNHCRYARATKAVSLPAPVYYAHHVCTQAKMRLLGHQLIRGGQCPWLFLCTLRR